MDILQEAVVQSPISLHLNDCPADPSLLNNNNYPERRSEFDTKTAIQVDLLCCSRSDPDTPEHKVSKRMDVTNPANRAQFSLIQPITDKSLSPKSGKYGHGSPPTFES